MKTSEYIERGLNLVRVEEYDSALRHFRELPDLMEHTAATSYYALCLAVVEKKFDEAIALCLAAVKREFYNPDIYYNLGIVYMMNSQKALAIRVFRRGLLIDDNHREIKQKILEMGVRQRPPISFLSRNNIANKYLGRVVRRKQQGGKTKRSA